MHLRRHPSAVCDYCGSSLYYGLKAEQAGWKVFYECTDDDCRPNTSVSFVPIRRVSGIDEVYEHAEQIGRDL